MKNEFSSGMASLLVIMRKRRRDMQDVTTADDGSVFTRLSRFEEGLGGRRRG